jgi:hypothetical protein
MKTIAIAAFLLFLCGMSPLIVAQTDFGQMLSLDGVSHILVKNGDIVSNLPNHTVELWFYWRGVSNPTDFASYGQDIYSENTRDGGTYRVSIGADSTLYFLIDHAYEVEIPIKLPGKISINTWYHIAGVLDSTSGQKFYVNRNLVGSNTDIRTQSSGSGPIIHTYFGHDQVAGGYHARFFGYIDEVRTWNIVKTQSQIQAAMYNTLGGNESGLIGYWKLDGNANDATANHNDGTLYGVPTFIISDVPSPPTTDTTTAWRMQIKASISSYLDVENYLGVADSASEGFDPSYDPAEPPASPGSYISLYFPHPEWNSLLGNNFAKDIKHNSALADTVKRWYFEVKSNVVNDTATLTLVNDRTPSAFGKYLTDLKTGKRINLKNTSLYKYYNTSDTARSFMIIIGDSTAPQLALTSPNGSNIWRSGASKNISWSTSDGTGIDSIFVYASSNGGSSYSLLRSLSFVQSASWAVPNEYLNHNYSVRVVSRDSLGNQSTVKSVRTFSVVGDSLAASNSAGWSLVSVPLEPNDSSTVSIFGNTSYIWSYAQLTGYTQPSKITLGNGYWLGVTATKNWFVKGTASEADSCVQNLQLGYNIIGNNFVRNVSKNNLYFLKLGSYYNFNSAVSAGLISNALYGYSASGYSAIDTMSLFGGYWIGVLQSGVQLIQKPNVSIVAPLGKQMQTFALNWELPIKASTASLTDNIAVIGIKPNSSNQFDAQYDAPRPPRNPGNDFLELFFTNSGGNYPAILGSRYARDFRDTSSAYWSFTVESSQNGDVVLGWDRTLLEGLSGTLNLNLTDNANGQTIDMKSVTAYTFTYSAPRQFAINAKITSVGKEQKNLPTDYVLSQNFPNPFNPSTIIQFGVPDRSRIKVEIFDMLGRFLTTIARGEYESGYYQIPFSATNLPSGVYVYRLTGVGVSNGKLTVQLKKMMLMK